MQFEGYNAAVTCGGVQSNHNRAVALMCARNGWACHLCIQDSADRFNSEKGNALLDRLSGAECEFITPEQTSEAMDRAMGNFRKRGFKPLYITGGGHDLQGGIAYVKAVQQLYKRCQEERYKPTYIFHASGTGSTQAGILVGLHLVGWDDVEVVGISVARQYERGKQVIADFANMLGKHYGCNLDFSERVHFNTDYLCGGYEQFTPEMKIYLESVTPQTGLVFDTTYSGKAFYGMIDYTKRHNLQGNILFWHTGGLMNLMK